MCKDERRQGLDASEETTLLSQNKWDKSSPVSPLLAWPTITLIYFCFGQNWCHFCSSDTFSSPTWPQCFKSFKKSLNFQITEIHFVGTRFEVNSTNLEKSVIFFLIPSQIGTPFACFFFENWSKSHVESSLHWIYHLWFLWFSNYNWKELWSMNRERVKI